MLMAILGAQPEPELVADVFSRSDGNPFFAEELLAASRQGRAGPRLPPTLREILLAHIAAVPETATAVLRVAAVAGRRVEHELLAEVAGLPEDELLDGLRAAVGGHLLVVEPGEGVERYAFRHALVQEVVYDELLPGERRNVHRAFAEALEARTPVGGAAEAGRWAELAHHWGAARQDERAFAASLRAADAAMSAYAFRAAMHEFERALDLWDDVEDPEGVSRVRPRRAAAQGGPCRLPDGRLPPRGRTSQGSRPERGPRRRSAPGGDPARGAWARPVGAR